MKIQLCHRPTNCQSNSMHIVSLDYFLFCWFLLQKEAVIVCFDGNLSKFHSIITNDFVWKATAHFDIWYLTFEWYFGCNLFSLNTNVLVCNVCELSLVQTPINLYFMKSVTAMWIGTGWPLYAIECVCNDDFCGCTEYAWPQCIEIVATVKLAVAYNQNEIEKFFKLNVSNGAFYVLSLCVKIDRLKIHQSIGCWGIRTLNATVLGAVDIWF